MSRTAKVLVGIVLAIVAGWYFASPYLVLHQMKSASEARDAEALSRHIDFPALKENLKASFAARVMADVAHAPDNEPFAAAGSALAIAMIGPMIDAMITPQAVAMMLQGETPDPGQSSGKYSASLLEPEISMGYRDLDTFAVTVSGPGLREDAVELILKRHGLFAWKLTAAELPL